MQLLNQIQRMAQHHFDRSDLVVFQTIIHQGFYVIFITSVNRADTEFTAVGIERAHFF
jgi:hypothetical protein